MSASPSSKLKTFLVSYDLRQPSQKYELLYESLKSYPAYQITLESTWIIKSHQSAYEIKNHLAQDIDVNDELIVISLSKDAEWAGLSEAQSEWLNDNLGNE
ncbi:MAG: SinR family protein [Lentisphaerae bacterium]|nr:SinR family protein [Lentisphaerota bacterium]MCP4100017.1 SinR family protein [Lentisphaerota bacterium]